MSKKKPYVPRPCEWEGCTKTIGPERGANALTCSNECAGHRHRKNARQYAAARHVPAGPKEISICARVDCDNAFAKYTRKNIYCSRRCAWVVAGREKTDARREHYCHRCGAWVNQPNKGRTVCDDCRITHEGNRKITVYEKNVRRRLKAYGLTLAEYEAKLEAQGGRCALYPECDATVAGGSTFRRTHLSWHVDHDHECCPEAATSCGECVRGLLCEQCNLNNFRDDPALLRRFAEYIEWHRSQRLSLFMGSVVV